MKQQRNRRLLALVLAMVMVLTMLPIRTNAAGITISGALETVLANRNDAALRENDFNKNWKFFLGDNSSASNTNFDDSSWVNVNVPHDFSITQHFTTSGEAESGFLPGGTGWYRKHFVLSSDAADKTFLLNFDGVYMHAYVYVNGSFVGEHHYGYTSFAFDITEHLVCDGTTENVVAVKAVNNLPSSRWYSGSGIYRDVTLLALDPIHVDLHGVTVTTPDISSGSGKTNVVTQLVNGSNAAVSATVKTTIREKGSETALASASATVTVAAGATATASTVPVVSSPKLWSVEAPNLYTVTTEVSVGGRVVDTYTTDFGFRWTEWKSTGFYLNGKAVKLNGVCMHHDQGALGAAAYTDAIYRQMSIMKDMGCNAIRITHNPGDEDLIAICNELGLLVIEEIFDGLHLGKNGNYNDFSTHFNAAASANLYGYESGMTCAEYATRSTLGRDRNAPSIIAWSMGNEIQQGSGSTSEYVTITRNFINWAQDVDNTRPITIGDNTRGSDGNLNQVIEAIVNAGGIAGYNYANSASELYNLCQTYGGSKGVIIASETSSAVNSRSVYKGMGSGENIDSKYHLTSYDTSKVSWGITAHDSIYNTYQYDCVAGEFVWTGFDYIGEPTPWNGTGTGSVSGGGAIPNSSYFGIVETTGFEKDTYYLYRSQWNKAETTVHLVTAWDSDNQMISGSTTPVWMYSNAPKVELWLNDNLIATATRGERTSAAGHTFYTYTSVSNAPSVCTVSNGSGSEALYGAYNVAYTAGTLTAKAYDTNNTLLGEYSVTTPGTVTQLKATVNRTEMAADGYSLAYVEVDVLDANGNLDTTASNNLTFTLSGPGEIAGVDNGDQGSIKKYQNSHVLSSRTSANIDAYAGKALVIVRSTVDAGEITLNIASSGLTGQTVKITTVPTGITTGEGLDTYTMIRDYSVKAGTVPTLDTDATGYMADGSTVYGTIAWDTIPAEIYGTAGDYTITGVLTFAGMDPIDVTGKLHVIPNVIDLRNVSLAVMEGTVPTLPGTVRGVLADGTLSGEFPVVWNVPSGAAYDTVGQILTVTGTAAIFGDETMDVTCTIRVAEAVNTESVNVAPRADTLTQDVTVTSDNLESIRNGVLKPGDNTNERWTNWNNRTRSDSATLTLYWNTAVMLNHVNLYYYDDGTCDPPESVEFSYSLNGNDYQVIGHTAERVEQYYLGYHYTYTFDEPINPIYLKVKLTQKGGTSGTYCVGLTELEAMTYAATFQMNSSADLSGIRVDGTAVPSFSADTLAYDTKGSTVTAETAVNAGITVLPVYEGVVRVLTVSEDGSASKTYEITVGDICRHANQELQNAAAATCTADGYSGDTVCTDCGQTIATGQVIPATGHLHTEVRDANVATCEQTGYTGDTWCTDCGMKIATGSTIAALGHKWNAGVITKEPTENEDGIKTYTCTRCGTTKTEAVKYEASLKAPTVSLKLSKTAAGKITIIGQVNDYANLDDSYEITAHGLVYIQSSRIGTRTLTVNTSGRTRVNFGGYGDDGSYSYSFKPSSKSTVYTYRAFLIYKDPTTGKSVTVYSDIMRCSYNGIGG